MKNLINKVNGDINKCKVEFKKNTGIEFKKGEKIRTYELNNKNGGFDEREYTLEGIKNHSIIEVKNSKGDIVEQNIYQMNVIINDDETNQKEFFKKYGYHFKEGDSGYTFEQYEDGSASEFPIIIEKLLGNGKVLITHDEFDDGQIRNFDDITLLKGDLANKSFKNAQLKYKTKFKNLDNLLKNISYGDNIDMTDLIGLISKSDKEVNLTEFKINTKTLENKELEYGVRKYIEQNIDKKDSSIVFLTNESLSTIWHDLVFLKNNKTGVYKNIYNLKNDFINGFEVKYIDGLNKFRFKFINDGVGLNSFDLDSKIYHEKSEFDNELFCKSNFINLFGFIKEDGTNEFDNIQIHGKDYFEITLKGDKYNKESLPFLTDSTNEYIIFDDNYPQKILIKSLPKNIITVDDLPEDLK